MSNEYKELTKKELIMELLSGKKMQSNRMFFGGWCEFQETATNPFRLIAGTYNDIMDRVWEHTHWREYKKTIPDKALVAVYDKELTHLRSLKFYDAKNKCTFQVGGNRASYTYKHYDQIEISTLPEPLKSWAIEAQKTLED